MEEIDLTKVEKVDSIQTGCIVGQHTYNRDNVGLSISGQDTTTMVLKCVLCGATVRVDGDFGISDLAIKYEEDAVTQERQKQEHGVDIEEHTGLGDEFWKRLRGK